MTLEDLGRMLQFALHERVEPCQCDHSRYKTDRTYHCPHNLKYEECKGHLILRMNKAIHELFWGCSEYPKCLNTVTFDWLTDLPKELREYR
jgi:hypothetical protein